MLHFLENHDEQRLSSPDFAGHAEKGKPAMVVSTTSTTAPTMIYFGQEVGEGGSENSGFGSHSRTSIFDYVGVPAHQRWVNNKQFDGGQLTNKEKDLRDFYKRLLNFTISSSALVGNYQDIHLFNQKNTSDYNDKILSFVRWSDDEQLIIVSNFDDTNSYEFELKIPEHVIENWKLDDETYETKDQLYNQFNSTLSIEKGIGTVKIKLDKLESFILKIQ